MLGDQTCGSHVWPSDMHSKYCSRLWLLWHLAQEHRGEPFWRSKHRGEPYGCPDPCLCSLAPQRSLVTVSGQQLSSSKYWAGQMIVLYTEYAFMNLSDVQRSVCSYARINQCEILQCSKCLLVMLCWVWSSLRLPIFVDLCSSLSLDVNIHLNVARPASTALSNVHENVPFCSCCCMYCAERICALSSIYGPKWTVRQ